MALTEEYASAHFEARNLLDKTGMSPQRLADKLTAQIIVTTNLEAALRELVEACEADAGVPGPDDEDEEAVGAGRDESGAIKPMALTFGMLRRARAALAG